MNKKFKKLLMAGLVTVITGTSVVQSSALSKEVINTKKTKGMVYLYVNGKKYQISLGCNNKPSQDENSSNVENNNSSDNNDSSIGNDSNQDNNDNENNNDGNIDNNNQSDSNTNTGNENGSTSNSFSDFQEEVIRLVNVERSKRGLSELPFNTQLCNVATLKSQDMINNNYFSHTSPTYGSPFDMIKQFNISYKTAGENIAKGQKTPQEVVNAWMNSKGHRENILNSNFTDIGVGVAISSNGILYWTQMFIGK